VHREFKQLFQDLELPQPPPRGGDTPTSVRIDHVRQLQRFCDGWKGQRLGTLAVADPGIFEIVASDIVTAAKRVASNPTVGSLRWPNRLRPVVRTDGAGVKTVRWMGKPDFWMRPMHDGVLRCLTGVGNGYGTWY
jgi:hypothetical protein